MEEVLATMKNLMEKFDVLKEDVDQLKQSNEVLHRSRSRSRDDPSPSRSRSRSTRKAVEDRSLSRSRSRPTRKGRENKSHSRSPVSRRHRSWADCMEDDENETPDYEQEIRFEDEDSQGETKLVEVSEKTKSFLEESCRQSLPNSSRIQTRSRFGLPKVAATRTPQLDPFMKTEVNSATKSTDKELARIQTFVLDSLAPLTSILECDNQGGSLSHEEVIIAVKTAVQLIGNTNAQISRLQREKVTCNINKGLLPLVKEEDNFKEAAPLLFGPDFAKKSKEYIEQVKAMRSSIVRPERQQFFRSGPPISRGGYSQRSWRGGSLNFRKGGRDCPFYRKGYQQNQNQAPPQNKGRN